MKRDDKKYYSKIPLRFVKDELLTLCVDEFGVTKKQILSRKRGDEVVSKARQTAHYFGYKFECSLSECGSYFGRRGHCTVINSIKAVERETRPLSTGKVLDPIWSQSLNAIDNKLRAYVKKLFPDTGVLMTYRYNRKRHLEYHKKILMKQSVRYRTLKTK